MPKYREYFRQMLEENEKLFSKFAELHEKYKQDRNVWQEDYNNVGSEVLEEIRKWETKLCGYSEKGVYAKYSTKLAEKFREEVKAFFPLIDFIGVSIVKGNKTKSKQPKAKETSEEVDDDLLEIEKIEVLFDDFPLKKLI